MSSLTSFCNLCIFSPTYNCLIIGKHMVCLRVQLCWDYPYMITEYMDLKLIRVVPYFLLWPRTFCLIKTCKLKSTPILQSSGKYIEQEHLCTPRWTLDIILVQFDASTSLFLYGPVYIYFYFYLGLKEEIK